MKLTEAFPGDWVDDTGRLTYRYDPQRGVLRDIIYTGSAYRITPDEFDVIRDVFEHGSPENPFVAIFVGMLAAHQADSLLYCLCGVRVDFERTSVDNRNADIRRRDAFARHQFEAVKGSGI